MKILKTRRLVAWVLLFVNFLLANSVLAGQSRAPASGISQPLVDLINSLLVANPELQAIKAELLSVKAGLRAADQAIYNPEIEFDYEKTDVKTQSIGISQTIDWGDQRGSRTGIAQAELDMAMANYELATQSFINKLLGGIAEHQTGTELSELSQQTLKLMQDFSKNAERRYQAGDLSRVELNLARLAYNQALMEQAGTISDAAQAREQLRSILGDLPATLPALPEQMPDPELNSDLESFMQTLPVIRIQLAQLRVSHQQVELRKSEKAWDPTVSVSAGSEGDFDLIGFNLSIPLNIRNSYSAEVDAAQQDLIANEQRTQLAYRDARGRLIVTTERYLNLLNAWNSWRENSSDSVDQQLKLIKQLWQAGDLSAAEYLLQLKQALETQAAGLELRRQLWLAAFDWMSQTSTLDSWLNIKLELPAQINP